MKYSNKAILLSVCLFFSIICQAVNLYVGGPSETLPRPMPPAGGTLETVNYMPDGGAEYYIMCIGNSVTATNYTDVRLKVRCDYWYTAVVGHTSLGQPIINRYSGSTYYYVNILPVYVTNVPSSLFLNIGDKYDIDWSYSPSNVNRPHVEWKTSNYSVASVSDSWGTTITANGSGVAYITGKNNAGPNVEIKVIVNDMPVENASIPSTIEIMADEEKTIPLTVTPSNGTVNTQEWTSADPSIARIEKSTGKLTGIWPGTTKVWCVVNGTIRTNDATVTVTEPPFTFKGFSLADGATGVETMPTLTAEFSHSLSQGDNYGNIALTGEGAGKVDGTLTISGTTLSFKPSKSLQPLTRYTWTIPAGAVENRWGTSNASARTVSFTTTDYQHMTLSVQPDGKFLSVGDKITLSCSVPEATIYYSTDGSSPTKVYTNPLTFWGSMTLRAIAKLSGYHDSNELRHEYFQSVEIAEKYPDQNPLYNYADVNPSITYTYPIKRGSAFGSIAMKDGDGKRVDCQLVIQGRTLYFVVAEPLENGTSYNVTMPEGALVTDKGEESQVLDWKFSTGFYATAVSMGGPELTAAIMIDRSLWTWGRWLTEANSEDGSYSYTVQNEPASFVGNDVKAVSSGFIHHALLKRDGTLWMWGRQLCGEFGNGTTNASAQPVKILGGVKDVSCGLQTTAIVKQDGTLWMCGRNDLGQIDDSRTVYKSFVKIADGVEKVTLGWGSITFVKTDGKEETRTWDDRADKERQPADAGLEDVEQVAYGWHSAVALRQGGSVWTWGTGNTPREVIAGRTPKQLEGINLSASSLKLEVGERALVVQRPKPLLADYTELTWKSDNEAVATVSNRGMVSGRKNGETSVTVTISDANGMYYEAKCKVTVGEPSGITSTLTEEWNFNVAADGRRLLVSGVPEGRPVSVYNHAGVCVWQGRMAGDTLTIPVSHSSIYIVRAGRQAKKIAVRE